MGKDIAAKVANDAKNLIAWRSWRPWRFLLIVAPDANAV
jgi:hypothetical protein